jgi:hypothetical protein
MKNLFTFYLWFAGKTLQAVTKIIVRAWRTIRGSKVASDNFNSKVLMFSSLVRAFNVFCGLEMYDYLALNETSLYGVTTIDICCFRGVTALALITLE